MAPPDREQPDAAADRPEAVLLVGPTAAGKTPLGDALQAGGLWGRACRHFDSGRGDRAERDDDDPARVRRKLAIYRERTEPLLAHYAACGVPVIPVNVAADATAEAMREELERQRIC